MRLPPPLFCMFVVSLDCPLFISYWRGGCLILKRSCMRFSKIICHYHSSWYVSCHIIFDPLSYHIDHIIYQLVVDGWFGAKGLGFSRAPDCLTNCEGTKTQVTEIVWVSPPANWMCGCSFHENSVMLSLFKGMKTIHKLSSNYPLGN